MKTRIIDKFSIPSMRQPSDEVWLVFANHLVTAFGDPLIQHGTEPELLSKLYSPHRVREQDERTLDSIVYTVPPAFVPFRNDDIEESKQKIHWGASRKTPFLLLGHVGTGKTVFLDHTFLHRLPKDDPKIKAIIIDFLQTEDIEGEFRFFLLKTINAGLNDIEPSFDIVDFELLNKLFANEVAAIKATLPDKESQSKKINDLFSDYVTCHLPGNEGAFKEIIRRKIECLEKQYTIWIILDNIDQHHTCLHNTAFVSAVALANGFKANLIIAMRYISLATPAARSAYNSYRPRKLKLSSPNVSDILTRRLEYFKYLASDIMGARLKWTGYRLNVDALVADVERVVDLLSDSDFLKKFLLPLSNYNIRRLLEIILSVFQSYFFFYDRFNNERYIPTKRTLLKRFIFAHLLKNEDYFGVERDEKESFIINLFENENSTFCCNQTIRLRVLQALMSKGHSTTLRELTALIMSTFDYQEHDLLNAYRAFLRAEMIAIKGDLNLIYDNSIIHDGLTDEHLHSKDTTIAITYAGRMHFELLSQLEYIEIMKFSTYVPAEVSAEIQAEDRQKTIAGRAACTRKFLKYLADEEDDELRDHVIDQPQYEKYFGKIVPTIIKNVETELKHVVQHSHATSF